MRTMYLSTVCSATSWPNRSSSDKILGAPHIGFSRDMRRIKARISRSMHGRPGLPGLDFHLQYSLNPIRCHWMTVSGCTMASAERQFGHSRDSNTQKTRSRGRNFGRLTDCLNTATCCRSARISIAAAARPRMNALRNTTIDGKMPMIRCSRTRQRGNRTGMGQPGQTAGDVSFPNGHRIPRFGSSLVWEIDYADVKSQFLQMTQVLTWQRGRSFWEGQVCGWWEC